MRFLPDAADAKGSACAGGAALRVLLSLTDCLLQRHHRTFGWIFGGSGLVVCGMCIFMIYTRSSSSTTAARLLLVCFT